MAEPAAPGPASPKPRTVPCPACRQPALFSPENPYRPFCSARCQGNDFGAWANEAYRVSANPPPDDKE
ncbi:DNA gyrase inhibitor YacG [Ideonella sp.]|uniref:DNA gyrase inhibitor YacG n=1 Tax=Ideonella sp. TaxID=1929293 RepID=UPI002B4A3950|nr:DNA gyrase inhibitor YacG [Ideonella sp.]HJV69036.1 DNA gyrase inhibitor YacG [Ideonella sp.]